MLYIHEMFLIYKLEIFKNRKKAKNMIIAIIYIIFYVIFHQKLNITFEKSSALTLPLEKIHFPLFTHSPLKIQKV